MARRKHPSEGEAYGDAGQQIGGRQRRGIQGTVQADRQGQPGGPSEGSEGSTARRTESPDENAGAGQEDRTQGSGSRRPGQVRTSRSANAIELTWSTSCPDWEERIVDGRSLVPGGPLFADEAEAALSVFKSLRIVDVSNTATFGNTCEDWVFDWVRAIFGAYDAKNARRLIKDFFLLISKKNFKSTIAAGIMVTALIRNWRHNAELLILAPTKEVANNSFVPAAAMVRADEELDALIHVIENTRTLRHLVTGAELKVVAADSDIVSGKKAGFILIDELWLFGKRPNADAMLREATGGMSNRSEGFVIKLSTHSDEAPAGVFKAALDRSRDIRDGKVVDPTSMPILYEWPAAMLESEAYLDPANFYVTNPNLCGLPNSMAWIAAQLEEAKMAGGASLQVFLAKHLNVEIGLRLRNDRWRAADFWEGAIEPGLTLDKIIAGSDVLVAGIDGGGLDDLLGLGVIGRERDSRRWLHWGHAWAWRGVLDLRKDIAPALLDFEGAGDLTLVDDTDGDIAGIVSLLVKLRDSGLFPEKGGIGVDAAGLGILLDAMADAELEQPLVTAVGQAWRLNSAIAGVPRKLKDRSLVHCGQSLMAWSVSNTKVLQGSTAMSVNKAQAGSAKIDPTIALLNAAKLMELNPVVTQAAVPEIHVL